MRIVYQVITFILNFIAVMLAATFVFSLPAIFSSSLAMLSGFVIVSLILYTGFSYKFNRTVLVKQEPVKAGLRDWVRVNGIVSIVFAIIIIVDVVALIQNPAIFQDALDQMGYEEEIKNLNSLFYGMLVYAVLLLTHIFLTFSYMKKNKEYFQHPE